MYPQWRWRNDRVTKSILFHPMRKKHTGCRPSYHPYHICLGLVVGMGGLLNIVPGHNTIPTLRTILCITYEVATISVQDLVGGQSNVPRERGDGEWPHNPISIGEEAKCGYFTNVTQLKAVATRMVRHPLHRSPHGLANPLINWCTVTSFKAAGTTRTMPHAGGALLQC